jgi:hypothetical protein
MSIQFRSRIKSTLNYAEVLNGIGVCCDKNGNKSLKAFYDCFKDGGNFFPGNTIESVTCPPVDIRKGCCCACSFMADTSVLPYPWNFDDPSGGNPLSGIPYLGGGLVCGVTKCECDRINGKWTESDQENVTLLNDNWKNYCTRPATEFGLPNKIIDVRYPRSCCKMDTHPETGWPTNLTCVNTCTAVDCAALGSPTYPTVYDDVTTCTQNLYSLNGNAGGISTCGSSLRLSQIVNKSKQYKDSEFGSCYTLELSKDTNSYEYTCGITPRFLCDGYWKESTDPLNPYCNDKYTPEDPIKSNNIYQQTSMSQVEFDNLNLKIGDEYQGGIFIGIFEPGSPINPKGSQLFGDLNFKAPEYYHPTEIGVGGQHKKWAIIVNESIYKLPFIESDEEDIYYQTSLWDGYYNTYGDSNFQGIRTRLTNSIKYKKRNGFIDYYIPSIHELYFYSRYLQGIRPTLGKYPINGILMSSSVFSTKYINAKTNRTMLNNHGMIYGQEISDANILTPNFRTILINKIRTTDIIFFRRILIQN